MPKNEMLDLYKEMADELAGDAAAIAPALAAIEYAPDQEHPTEREWLDYVTHTWFRGLPRAKEPVSPEQWRHDLAVRIGAEPFVKLAERVVPRALAEQQEMLAAAQPQLPDLLSILMGGVPPGMPGMPPPPGIAPGPMAMPVVQGPTPSPVGLPPGMPPPPPGMAPPPGMPPGGGMPRVPTGPTGTAGTPLSSPPMSGAMPAPGGV